MEVEYRSNNSGGRWWLKDKDWKALEKAGWEVSWEDGRWLGALATSATKNFSSLGDAIREWEKVTGQDSTDEGCNCCGAPHNFSTDDSYCSGEDCSEYLYPSDFASLFKRELLKKLINKINL